jgi:hypothetical protein
VMLLEYGRVKQIGPAAEVVEAYAHAAPVV